MTYIAIRADHSKLRKVRRRLRRRGVVAYVPAIVATRIVPKGLKTRRKRQIGLLMSYILVRVPDHGSVAALWLHDVLSIKDVRGFVRSGDGPACIADAAVDDLKQSVAKIRDAARLSRSKASLRRGAKAAIKSGSLAGKVGTIAWLKSRRVGLEAKLFGSTRIVVVDKSNLEAA